MRLRAQCHECAVFVGYVRDDGYVENRAKVHVLRKNESIVRYDHLLTLVGVDPACV